MHPIALIDLKAQQDRLGDALPAAMNKVLEHGQYIMGPEVGQLESKLAQYAGVEHALACSSGTDALLLIMMAMGIGPGHAVVCPTFTFCATAETVALLGATPVFADVDPHTFNIDPQSVVGALGAAREAHLEPKAIIAVDLFGLPADYSALNALVATQGEQGHELALICDAAQGFGAAVDGKRVGSHGAATALSFFPSKTLGCYGDGGAVLTDDPKLADTINRLRVHGKGQHKYDNVMIGMSARLDTLQAAILLSKLELFDDELDRRAQVAARYDAGLLLPGGTPKHPQSVRHAWAQYTLRLPTGSRNQIAKALSDASISTAVYYPTPLHRMPAYQDFPRNAGGLRISEELAQSVLSLPMHPYLQPKDQGRVIETFNAAIKDVSG